MSADKRTTPRSQQRRAPASPSARAFTWHHIVIVLAVVATYWNSLANPFVGDDTAAILDNPQIREWWRLGRILLPGRDSAAAGRPLISLSFAINYALGGVNVWGYHVWNIAAHVTCGLLLYAVLRRTFELPALATFAGGRSAGLSFAAALLWVLHPLNSEVVDYTAQRTESMMAVFFLLTMYCSVRAGASMHAHRWQTAAVISCALGMTCKESMATAPLMIVLFDRVFVFDSLKTAVRSRGRFYAGLAATWTVATVLVASGPRSDSAGFSTGVAPWTYLLNQAVLIPHYLRLVVWPRGLVAVYGWPQPLTIGDAAAGALLVLGLLLLSVMALVRWPALGFLGAWVFVTLAPSSSVIPIATEVGAERRMYLPTMALAVLAVSGVAHLLSAPSRRRWAPVAVGVAAVALATGTIDRNREYVSVLSLGQTSLERRPSAFAHHIVGEELMAAGSHTDALAHLREAARGDSKAHLSLGVELYKLGQMDDAVRELQAFVDTWHMAVRPVPHWQEPLPAEMVTAHRVLAGIFAARMDWPRAEQEARLLAELRPNDVVVLTDLGLTLVSQNKFAEAVPVYRRAVEVDPQNFGAQRNLATVLLDSGNAAEAAVHAQAAVALNPNDPIARDLLTSAQRASRP